ncbi:MAG: hypothetical protein H7A36_02580 [Chlamydiales bacterium]|nr:hypothetical protein [Chlamydiales bacterium]
MEKRLHPFFDGIPPWLDKDPPGEHLAAVNNSDSVIEIVVVEIRWCHQIFSFVRREIF